MIRTFGYGEKSQKLCEHIDEYVEKIIKALTNEFGSKYAPVIRERLSNALYIFAERRNRLGVPAGAAEYQRMCLRAKEIAVQAAVGRKFGISNSIIMRLESIAAEKMEKVDLSQAIELAEAIERYRLTESVGGLSVPEEWEADSPAETIGYDLFEYVFEKRDYGAFCQTHDKGEVVYLPDDVSDSVFLHECIHAISGWHQSGAQYPRCGLRELAQGMVDDRETAWFSGSGLIESYTEYHAQKAARKADTIVTKEGNYTARQYYDLTYELLPFIMEFDSELARSYVGGEAASKFFGPQYVEFLKAADDVLDYNKKHIIGVHAQCSNIPFDKADIEAVRLHSRLESLMGQVAEYARAHGYGIGYSRAY